MTAADRVNKDMMAIGARNVSSLGAYLEPKFITRLTIVIYKLAVMAFKNGFLVINFYVT